MGRLVVSRNLLRRRYRSLFLIPLNCDEKSREKRGLSAFSTFLAKSHGKRNPSSTFSLSLAINKKLDHASLSSA
jgi:hypothetical protein